MPRTKSIATIPSATQHRSRPRNHREDWLKYTYGMTLADYAALLARQNGVCFICETREPGQTLAVDHYHATGVVRGLLCRDCNLGLGNYKDDPRLTRRATAYLEAHLARSAMALKTL
jgi:hypothetical protein